MAATPELIEIDYCPRPLQRELHNLMDSVLAGKKVPGSRLRELVGHTWVEVGGGVLLGVGMYLWLGIPAVP